MKTILTTLLLLLLFFIPVARVSAQTDPGVPPQPTPLLEGIDWDEWLLSIGVTPSPTP